MRDRTRLTLALTAVLLVACGGEAPAAAPPPSTSSTSAPPTPRPTADLDTGDVERLVDDLCTAAEADGVQDARRAFMNAHGPLHDLARDVVEADRQVAAQLHEAKQRAEAALDSGEADRIGRDLGELIDATRISLDTVGQPVGGCDERNAG